LSVANTMTSIPVLRTIVAAIFLYFLKLDFHSMGIGIKSRYKSVDMLKMNVDQIIGFDTAA
jgi:hypothetical protein